jgi:hypothetical protein
LAIRSARKQFHDQLAAQDAGFAQEREDIHAAFQEAIASGRAKPGDRPLTIS